MARWIERAQRHLPTLILLALFAWVFYPSFAKHVENGANPLRMHDDARVQIPPYYRYLEPNVWKDDYLGDYAISLVPVGHRLLYSTFGRFIPADVVGKAFGYLNYLATLIIVAWLASRLTRNRMSGWIAAAVIISSSVPMERMASGVNRAFAFPVMAMALACTMYGRVTKLAILVVVGSLFYPVAGLTAGAILAALLLLMPARDRGEAAGWSLPKRILALVLTAGVSAMVMLPTMIASRSYGGRVLDSEHDAYPEAGPLGTHGSEDIAPYPTLFDELNNAVSRTYVGEGDQLYKPARDLVFPHEKEMAWAFVALVLIGLLFAAWKREDVRRVFPYLAGVAVAHTVAVLCAPYFYAPSRYVLYAVIPALAVLLPVGLDALFRGPANRPRRPWVRSALGIIACALLLMGAGGRGSTTRGLTVHVNDDDAQIYKFISQLPERAMIAGWPDDPMSNVPYVGHRRALMTGEMHLAYHKGYLDEVRRRITDFFEAYYASSTGPIFALRDKYGVTHMFLELKHFQGPAPGYMPPLGARAKAFADANRSRGFELMRQLDRATVAKSGRFVLIDISKLVPTPQ